MTDTPVNVGDELYVWTGGWNRMATLRTVTRITKSGWLVCGNGLTFVRNRGERQTYRARGQSAWARIPTDADRKEVAHMEAVSRAVMKAVNLDRAARRDRIQRLSPDELAMLDRLLARALELLK